MKLPALPFLKKQTPKEYFLALLLEEEALRAVVFEESNGAMHTVGQGKSPLSTLLDETSYEDLLTAADKAISQAETNLPDGVQSHKTIFGVKQDWTENLQISKTHLVTLKKLCDELDLQPIGFLVFAEAIAHLLQKQEGAPVSGILINLGVTHITATLLRAGRVIASQQSPVAENLPKAVDALLGKFTEVEILPSRIILLDTKKRAHLTQQFLNHTWSKQLPFLHVPQISPLPEGFETKAILFGTATQMGFVIRDMPLPQMPPQLHAEETLSDEPPPVIEDNEQAEKPAAQNAAEEHEEEADVLTEENIPEEKPAREAQPLQGDNFGFVKDTDVLETMPHNPKAFHPSQTPDDESSDEFADETFADIPEEVKEHEEQSRLPGIGAQGVMITEGMHKVVQSLKKVPFSQVLNSLQAIPGLFAKEGKGTSPRLTLLIIPVVLILAVVGLLWYFLGLKATATLYLNPKTVQASQDVTFSSTDSTNTGSQIIGGTVVPIQEDGKVSTNATGKKDIGNKAQGTVTIYNNDDVSHTISTGTTITSSNGLKFITAKDVTVASASGDIFSGTKPGTQDVNVTAADIGTDYNLPSGTKFAIGSSLVIAAKNDNAFSGGTKQTVTVVSQADLDKLTQNLTNSLADKAKQDMQKNINGNQTVLPLFLSTDISNKQFDHAVGDQTSTVNLSATIAYQALSYSKDDLNTLAQAVIQHDNNDETISSNNLSIDIQNAKVSKDGKSIDATLAIKAGLLPKVDTASVAERLTGKSFDQATHILSDIPQLASVKATLSPNLFFLPHTFPRIASHIMVGVASNE